MTGPSFRVVTYNIRKAVGTDRRRDPDRILRILDGLAPDIVAMQEVDLRLPPRRPIFDRTRLRQVTGLRAVEFDHGRASLGWHGNALLFSEQFTVEHRAHRDLVGLEPRGLVEAVLRHKDGLRLRVFGLHLALLRSVRRQQVSHLLEMLVDDDLPMLAMGDFNERSVTKGLEHLAQHFRLLDSDPTFHSRLPKLRLDRIAVTEGIAAHEASVVHTSETRLASDHLPLMADLRFKG